jgi:hypothetical protein
MTVAFRGSFSAFINIFSSSPRNPFLPSDNQNEIVVESVIWMKEGPGLWVLSPLAQAPPCSPWNDFQGRLNF